MAQIWNDIKITTCEGRPCWVNGRRAIFHRWTDSARVVKNPGRKEDTETNFQKYSVHGLVEYEDGTMERHWPNVIQFADSDEHFQKFAWDAMEHRRDARAAADLKENDLPPVNIEVAEYCGNCAHENPLLWADQCAANDYSCPNCQAIDCICKNCTEGDKWEPKGGAV